MRPSLSNPWRRDDSAKRTNHELHITLDPNRKYHQRKPITIKLNEQKILYKLSQPHGDNTGFNYLSIPNLQWCNRWSLGMDKLFHPPLYNGYNYLSILGLQLIHICEWGPSRKQNKFLSRYNSIHVWFLRAISTNFYHPEASKCFSITFGNIVACIVAKLPNGEQK